MARQRSGGATPSRPGRAARCASPRGQSIRIINTHGTQVCDTWAFSATNRAEYLSWPHARAWINRAVPVPGDALVTNRRRPILTLIEDTSPGVHDTLIAACDLFRYITLGVNEYHDNCADNLRMAMMAIGLTVPEVPQPFNVWMNIPLAAGLDDRLAAAGRQARRSRHAAGRDGLHRGDVRVPAGPRADQR